MNTSNNAFQMIADFEGDLAQLLQNDKHDNPIPLLVTRNFVLFPGVIAPILIGREPSLNLIHKLDEGEDKTFALWLADNRLQELQLAETPPDDGREQGEERIHPLS